MQGTTLAASKADAFKADASEATYNSELRTAAVNSADATLMT